MPDVGRDAGEAFVEEHFAGLFVGEAVGSERFRGGQGAADAALAAFDVSGYAAHRNEVLPRSRRGASALSPYIRHGLLSLPAVWRHVAGGPARDVKKFRDELLWQEYARHWYARLGARTRTGIRRELPHADVDTAVGLDGWDAEMACMAATVGELERDGWLVNQTRMWLSSDWSVRNGQDVAGGRGCVLHPPARRVPRREPARLAVDDRRGFVEALRLQPLAGREAGPRTVP